MPLLPPQPRSATASASLNVTPRGPYYAGPTSPRVRVEETTEVQVNIGRIEITTLAGPVQAPRPRPSTQPKPMSLEDYLARRSERL